MKIKIIFSFFVFVMFFYVSRAQTADSTVIAGDFGGGVTVTNNGISLIPNLTLGKPAVIFDMSVGRRKLSFEPQLRFALEGKPWTFLFGWRYKLIERERFRVNIGIHPALAFKTRILTVDGTEREMITVRRVLAGEFFPSYNLSKNMSAGLYWLFARGFERYEVRNTNFLAIRLGFSNIRLSEKMIVRFNPQIYHLMMDEKKGLYFTAAVTATKKNHDIGWFNDERAL